MISRKDILNEWLNFDLIPKNCGIYCIEGIYIGRSEYPLSRVITHIQKCTNGTHENLELQEHVRKIISSNYMIDVKFYNLPNCKHTEKALIEQAVEDGIELVNRSCNRKFLYAKFHSKEGRMRTLTEKRLNPWNKL